MNKQIKLKKIKNKIRQIINLSKRQSINLSSDEELDDIPNDFIDFKNLSETNINLNAKSVYISYVDTNDLKDSFERGSWSDDSMMGYYGHLNDVPIVIFSEIPMGTDFKNEYKDEIGDEYLVHKQEDGRARGTFFVEDLVSVADIVNGNVKVTSTWRFKKFKKKLFH